MVNASLQAASEKITVVSDDSRDKISLEICCADAGNMTGLNKTNMDFLLFLPVEHMDYEVIRLITENDKNDVL